MAFNKIARKSSDFRVVFTVPDFCWPPPPAPPVAPPIATMKTASPTSLPTAPVTKPNSLTPPKDSWRV